jgi:dethiobiotin synthetase
MVYFVTSIHTDSGKTLVSAILTQALQADYWKPVQCGSKDRDTKKVEHLTNNGHSVFHEETYLFQEAMSPHAAAKREGREIKLSEINLPKTDGNHLIIEGAGGILVPLNEKDNVIDIAAKFDAQLILVSNHYLGSINHTLLTVNEIERRGLKVKGIIFNGEENKDTESIILKRSGYKCLLKIKPETKVDQEMITKYAIKLFENWDE